MNGDQMIDVREFRQAMGDFATGVTVVTTLDARHRPYGVTVNSFTSVSAEPQLVLVCIDETRSGLDFFLESRRFGVNILGKGQEETSDFFSQTGSDRASFPYRLQEDGLPMIPDSLAWIQCELVESILAGDHRILLGRVITLERLRPEAAPLVFFRGAYGDPER